MNRFFAVLVLSGISAQAQTITETFGSGTNQFSIEFVEIGNPGNAADTTGSPNPVGSVNYVYNLGKYEISRETLEKANLVGGLGITLGDMSFLGGNGADRPAIGITWNEAARFVNWLNTSKGYQVAYNFTTGAVNDNITLWAAGQYIGNNQYRHKDAHYFLPSSDEWYKAAYSSPAGLWYNFATESDTAPLAVSGGTSIGTAVYGGQTGPSDITSAGALSAYGTMAQSGNVWEWTESAYDGVNDSANENREFRGGAWDTVSDTELGASIRGDFVPNSRVGGPFGLRIAMVPEPSSLLLLLAGGAVLMAGRRRMPR